MKKWERAEINCIDINATEHQWEITCQWDGGYLGDGKITGWFGPDPKPDNTNCNHGDNTDPGRDNNVEPIQKLS